MSASHRAVTKVNARVASKVLTQGPSPQLWGEGSMERRRLTDAADHSGGVIAAARWQGRAKQLEKPSSPRREIGGAGKPYNRRPREIGGRREGGGGTRSTPPVQGLPGSATGGGAESQSSMIGHINFEMKQTGKPSAGNPHAGFDAAGIGNQFTVWLVRHSQRKRGAMDRPDLRGDWRQSSTLLKGEIRNGLA